MTSDTQENPEKEISDDNRTGSLFVGAVYVGLLTVAMVVGTFLTWKEGRGR